MHVNSRVPKMWFFMKERNVAWRNGRDRNRNGKRWPAPKPHSVLGPGLWLTGDTVIASRDGTHRFFVADQNMQIWPF